MTDSNPFESPSSSDNDGDWQYNPAWKVWTYDCIVRIGFVFALVMSYVVPMWMYSGYHGRSLGWLIVMVCAGTSLIFGKIFSNHPRRFAIRWDESGLTGPCIEKGKHTGWAVIDFGKRVTVRSFPWAGRTEVEDDGGNCVVILHRCVSRSIRARLLSHLEAVYAQRNQDSSHAVR